MTGAERVTSWFESGRLVRPDAEVANFVDLTLALATIADVEGVEATPNAQAVLGKIAPTELCVFILIDGLGIEQVGALPSDSFLRTHLAA